MRVVEKPSRQLARRLLGGEVGKLSLGACEEVGRQDAFGLELRELRFKASHGEAIRAVFLPARKPMSPAVLYCHAHGGAYEIGVRELIDGRPALVSSWLPDLAALGAAVLCLEMPCFGQRLAVESALSKRFLWHGKTLFGRMLAELLAGLDWLASQPDIDPQRLATLGISMGGTHAWWLAALDPRLKAAVSLCALADLDCLINLGLHDKHGPYMTIPGLLAHGRTGQWAALAAPTPLFVGLGLQDWSSPGDAVDSLRADLEPAYEPFKDHLVFHLETDGGHQESAAMRAAAKRFLRAHLIEQRVDRETNSG